MVKDLIINFLKSNETLKEFELEKFLEVPKKKQLGDFSLPLFVLAKKLSKNPQEISKQLEIELNKNKPNFIKQINSMGPFLNFYINYDEFGKKILEDIFLEDYNNFEINIKKYLIEFPSPNTNKSLHVGHVRNMLIGLSLTNLLKKVGHRVIHTNLNNDRGIAIAKCMLMYDKYGENKTPKDLGLKPDKFVEKFYVMFSEKVKENPMLEDEALDMLKLWEDEDKRVRQIWKKLLSWVYEGYDITYKRYKLFNFDKQYFESDIFNQGKELVLDALNKNIKGFKQDEDGAVYVDFEDETYGKKYLLRPNGTTLYMTQDLYLAKLKQDDFNPDKSIFIVGKEQKYHFEVLFELLERLNILKKDQNLHYAYGYVFDKDGGKFSSRKGNVIGADELYEMAYQGALDNLKEKELTKNLDIKELEQRAEKIAFAALSFSFLKVNPLDDMKFDTNRALSFEGETGPYILYTYARIKSIIRKSGFDENDLNKVIKNLDKNNFKFNQREENILSILNEYKNTIIDASSKYKLSSIANYLLKLSKSFNEYYQNVKILEDGEEKIQRLVLIYAISLIIKDALSIYGIDVLEQM